MPTRSRAACGCRYPAAQGIFPIPGASVEVYRDFGAVRETFYSGVTDSSGIADRILLPALPASLGLSSDTAGHSRARPIPWR